jgi:hypothetical protein
MKLTPIDLGNGILLFKNVLKDPKKTYEFILDSKTNDDPFFGKDIWHEWQPWGNYAKAYPNDSDEYKTSDAYGAELQRECLDIFFNVLEIHKEHFKGDSFFERNGFPEDYPTSLEELKNRHVSKDHRFDMADVVIFETNKNVNRDWQMYIHQDTTPYFGLLTNHMFNFNIYINDDYEGGEILFFKHQDTDRIAYVDSKTGKTEEAWIVEDFFEYKMEAGDAMIFPVDLYHGVKPIGKNDSKYYIRQFITHNAVDEFEKAKQEILNGSLEKHPVLDLMVRVGTKTEEEIVQLVEDSRKEAFANRKNPILFNSIEDIDVDVSLNQVACIINSRKNIKELI